MTKIFLKKRNYQAFVKLENKDKLSIELKDLEDDLATDVALKRAFFTSGRLAARILAWVERLSSDIAACAELEGP